MSEPVTGDTPTALALRDRHDALRLDGADRLDPARFAHLARLLQRLDTAPAAVRPLLEGRLALALADYGERFRQTQETASDALATLLARHPARARDLQRLFKAGDYTGMRRLAAQATAQASPAPLAELNQYIQQASQPGTDTGAARVMASRPEMKSVVRFRETWSRISAEVQVSQAVERGPVNAGPMNSHLLVLRSLALMNTLSPDYLRRFLSQVDTLLWLEQASEKTVPVEAKPARRVRTKK